MSAKIIGSTDAGTTDSGDSAKDKINEILAAARWADFELWDSDETSGGVRAISLAIRSLTDAANQQSLSWRDRLLSDSSGVTAANWLTRVLRDSGAFRSIDWENRQLLDAAGALVASWGVDNLTGDTGVKSIFDRHAFGSAELWGDGGSPAIMWEPTAQALLTFAAALITAGVPLDMGANKIQNLADGTLNQDAATWLQVQARLALAGGNMTGPIDMQGNQITDADLDGTTLAGDIAAGGNRVTGAGDGVNPQDYATKNQLDLVEAALNALYQRRRAVIDYVDNTAAPPTEVSGDRYILDFTGASHANWDGAAAGDIVEFNGTTWDATSPQEGWVAYVDASDTDRAYVDDGSPTWEDRNPAAGGDHGALTGLLDDDHTQYLLASGARSWAGDFNAGGNDLSNLANLGFTALSEVTISGNTATLTGVLHSIDTEGDAASDDLQAVTAPGGGTDSRIHFIRAEDAGRTVVIKHGDVNIFTATGADLSLDDTEKVVMLIWDDAQISWLACPLWLTTDHGALGGLGDDDHPQYLRTDGTRAWTGSNDAADNSLQSVKKLSFGTGGAWSELTIAGGVITVTDSLHLVDTESDAASDDVDTISAPSGEAPLVFFRAANAARTVNFKDATGNIATPDGNDVVLDDTQELVLALWEGTGWVVFPLSYQDLSNYARKDQDNAFSADQTINASSGGQLTLGSAADGWNLNANDFGTLQLRHGTTVVMELFQFAAATMNNSLYFDGGPHTITGLPPAASGGEAVEYSQWANHSARHESGGADEIDHDNLLNYDVAQHRTINDAGTAATDLWSANKISGEFQALESKFARKKAVIDYVDATAAPPTEVSGDRYILDDTAGTVNAAWDGAAKLDIVEFNGTTWDAVTPEEGWVAYVDAEDVDRGYIDDGSPTWEQRTAGGTTDHGALTGLGDDDHAQYHNDARGDARYTQRSNNLSDLGSAATARTNLGVDPAGTDNAPDATTTVKGKAELATDGENAADKVVQGNDSRINTWDPPSFIIHNEDGVVAEDVSRMQRIPPWVTSIDEWHVICKDASGNKITTNQTIDVDIRSKAWPANGAEGSDTVAGDKLTGTHPTFSAAVPSDTDTSPSLGAVTGGNGLQCAVASVTGTAIKTVEVVLRGS